MSAARFLMITEITSTDKGRRPQAMSATPLRPERPGGQAGVRGEPVDPLVGEEVVADRAKYRPSSRTHEHGRPTAQRACLADLGPRTEDRSASGGHDQLILNRDIRGSKHATAGKRRALRAGSRPARSQGPRRPAPANWCRAPSRGRCRALFVAGTTDPWAVHNSVRPASPSSGWSPSVSAGDPPHASSAALRYLLRGRDGAQPAGRGRALAESGKGDVRGTRQQCRNCRGAASAPRHS
jgi:hypothetical protein